MTPALPTVVVVDDAADLRALVKTHLRLSRRLTVVGEGATGVEAIDLASEYRPDLLLLDVSMPEMDGLEALPRVLEASPGTRVVMFTGFKEHGLVERARDLGAVAFFEKSLSIRNLAADLIEVLDTHGAPAAPPPTSTDTDTAPLEPDAVEPDIGRSAEEILGEHLERFREVFEEAAIGIGTITLTGRVVRANKALLKIIGRPVEDVVGRSWVNLISGSAPGRFRTAIGEVTDGGRNAVQLEHGMRTAGDPRRVLTTLAPVRDAAGRPLYLFIQVQDVTGQRAAEEALRLSEERFRLLVEAVGEYAIFMLDPQGHIVSWNTGAQRLKGYSAEEIIGQHFSIFYPEDKRAIHHPEHELEIALREGRYQEEGWRIRKDGSQFWANVLITAVFNSSGTHVGFAKVTRDVTTQRFAEDALRQSEERFRLLVEAVTDYAIFMLDPQGHIVSWNTGAQRLKGYSAEEIIGQHFSIFYPEDKRAIHHPEHELEIALREGRYEEEGWRIRKDGSQFWANVVITAVFDAVGRHMGFAKITRDVTERRRMLEEQLAATEALSVANRELAVANELLSTAADDRAHFLAMTAHELRSPIGVITGSAELLRRHWPQMDDDERGELFEAMSSNTARLRRLLDDLLVSARLEASAIKLDLEDVSISDVVASSVTAAQQQNADLPITADLEHDLHIIGDSGRIAQIADNLISNAVRHGRPPVRVVTRRRGDGVEIRVSDSGAGVAPHIQGRLFDRFATGVRQGGTGLGLFIVRELARAQHGDAWYLPAEEGAGPTFVVYLPLDAS